MGETKPGEQEIQVSVCMGTNCAFRGASQLIEALVADEEINRRCTIVETACLNDKCDHAKNSPVIRIGDEYYTKAKPEAVLDELHARLARLPAASEP